SWKDVAIRWSLDGGVFEEDEVTTFAVANGRYFGGGMQVAPGALIDDGLFGITVWRGYGLYDLVLKSGLGGVGCPVQSAGWRTSEDQVRERRAALRAPMGCSELDPAETAARGHRAERLRSEALSHSYRLSVPAKGFTFGRYRSEQQEIELDGNRPLRALDGALSLDLAGIDEVAFQASPAQVRDWNARKRAGELSLVVQFRPSGEPC